MTDTLKLELYISKSGYKVSYISKCLNLSTQGFKNKINNKTQFKTEEISILCDLLKIDTLEEKESVFFAQKVENKSTSEAV